MKFRLSLIILSLSLLFASDTVFNKVYAGSHFPPPVSNDVDVSATIDKDPPSVTITNPTGGSTVFGSIDVDASATDDVGVVRVEFFVDGSLVNTDTTAPFGFVLDTTSLTDGSHTILARAFDGEGKTGTDTITVNVNNTNPPLQSPTSKIQDPVIGPPTAATGPAKRTTLVQIPEEKEGILFFKDNKDFWLGITVGLEVIAVIFLIFLVKHSKRKNKEKGESQQ